MKAAVLHQAGEIPRYEDFAEPIPQAGTELIRVKAAALKNIDKGLASGAHYGSAFDQLPMVVGVDGVGVLADGRRVIGMAKKPYGLMAELALVNSQQVFELPPEIDDVTAAALLNPGMSAWFGVHYRAELQPGQSLLVLGATGVTGRLAVQIAKARGAGRIVAAGRNPASLAELEELGADEVISLNQPEDELQAALAAAHRSRPFDAVLDYVWGRPAEILLAALTGRSLDGEGHLLRYIQVGAMAGANISLSAATLRSSNLQISGIGGGSVPRQEMARVMTHHLPQLFALAASGQIRIQTEVMPLSQVSEAWQRQDVPGKRIVLVP